MTCDDLGVCFDFLCARKSQLWCCWFVLGDVGCFFYLFFGFLFRDTTSLKVWLSHCVIWVAPCGQRCL